MIVTKTIHVSIIVIAFIGIISIAIGAMYTMPNAEDLGIAAGFKNIGFWERLKIMLLFVDGRYTTNFFHGISPLVWWGYDSYFLLPLFSYFIFVFAILLFTKGCLPKTPTYYLFIISTGVAAVFFSVLESLGETLYCWGGSLVYVFPCAFSLLWMGLLFLFIRTQRSVYIVLSMLFLFLTSGFNEMFLAFTGTSLITGLFYFCLYDTKQLKFYLPLMAVGLSGMILILTLPGTNQKVEVDSLIIDQISNSSFWKNFILDYFQNITKFYLSITVLSSFFVLTAITNLIIVSDDFAKHINFLKATALIWFATAFFMAVIFNLSMYDGVSPPKRVYTPVYFVWYLSTLLFLIATTHNARKIFYYMTTHELLSATVCVILLIGITGSNSNYRKMYVHFKRGDLYSFKKHMTERLDLFTSVAKSDLVWKNAIVPPITNPPELIFNPTEPEANRSSINWNYAYEEYFRIDNMSLVGDTILRFKTMRDIK